MNQRESKAVDKFKKFSELRILVKRIENQLNSGTPDTMCSNRRGVSFWIEFKSLEAWPKRATTAPLKGKFERGQISQLREWMSWNGTSFVILEVQGLFVLLDPRYELEVMTQDHLMTTACVAHGLEAIIKRLEGLMHED